MDVDLSRFEKCTIKKPMLADLMEFPEFEDAANAYVGEITNEVVFFLATNIWRQWTWAGDEERKLSKALYIEKNGTDAWEIFRNGKSASNSTPKPRAKVQHGLLWIA